MKKNKIPSFAGITVGSGIIKKIDWKKCGRLVPAIIQSIDDDQVLMLGYMNQEAFRQTLKTGKVWFYSRTKKRLWMKGETSGNYLWAVGVFLDCDMDTVLIKVKINGPVCHNGTKSCFGNALNNFGLRELFNVIEKRKKEGVVNSYTVSLFKAGLEKICEKVNEESEEVIRAAKKESKKRLAEESVDLIYHMFVLLVRKGVQFDEILKVITSRNHYWPVKNSLR